MEHLLDAGVKPYWHQRLPPNDGGLSAGQIAAWLRAHRAAGLGTTAVSPVAVRARVADPSHAGQHVAAAGALLPASWAVAWRAPEA